MSVSHRSGGFARLWSSQVIAGCGGALGGIALPMAVVDGLGASATQVGVLKAVEFGAVPAFATVAGVLADRCDRRRLLLAAGTLRALAVALVPFALAWKSLGIALVIAAAATGGFATAVCDTTLSALVPALFPAQIRSVNERLAMGGSLAEMFGTGVAGAVAQALGAQLSLAGNALALVGAAALNATLPLHGTAAPPDRASAGLGSGFRMLAADALLLRIVSANALSHFGGAMSQAVIFIYFFRELHVGVLGLGIVLALANAGVAGAAASARLADRIGVRATCAFALVGRGLGTLCMACALVTTPLAAIAAARLLQTFFGPLFEVQQQNRQSTVVDPAVLGRTAAAIRMLVWGALPLGALAGGLLAAHAGTVPVLVAAGTVSATSSLLLVSRPRTAAPRRCA